MRLMDIVQQLEACGYYDQVGALVNHPAFVELKAMAEVEVLSLRSFHESAGDDEELAEEELAEEELAEEELAEEELAEEEACLGASCASS